jgi:endonuclease YncB( thermonuclease family)
VRFPDERVRFPDERVRFPLRRFVFLFLFTALAATAAPAPWSKLEGCSYVPHANNDGDSFHVRCGADEFVLRLYFVDSPETNLLYPERTREQAEHFGATLDDALKAGARARSFVREALRGPFTVTTRKASAPGRAKDPRFYGMVEVGGRNLDEMLVLQGLARVKGVAASVPGEKARAHAQRLQLLEDEAKRKGRGLWARKK